METIDQINKRDTRNQYAKRQKEKYERLAKYSLDEENKVRNQHKADVWKNETYYLARSHIPGANVTKERLIVNEAVASVPEKVQNAIHSGTIIDIGQIGASQYDYFHDILYVAKGADKKEVIHEIGHMVENKLLNEKVVTELRKKIVGSVTPFDLSTDTYYDTAGNAVDIFILKRDNFVSEYQGRIYAEDILEAFNMDGSFKDELLWEFVSEAFREFVENPEGLKKNHREFYDLIAEGIK